MDTRLVKKGELAQAITQILTEGEQLQADLELTLPQIHDPNLIKLLKTRLTAVKECIVALKAGYIPVEGGWFWDVETKSHWGKRAVADVLKTMPEEVKAAMTDAQRSGVFKKVAVNGNRRGDPMLVGKTGRKNFLIAQWCTFEGGLSIGYICRGDGNGKS